MLVIVTFLLHLAVSLPAEMTAANQRQVQVGDEVTLPCGNLLLSQNCEATEWIFTYLFSNGETEQLVTSGRLNVFIKPGRLSLTRNCSLIIKNVQIQDEGRYLCRRFGQDFTNILLSVVPNDAMVTTNPTTTKRRRTTGLTPQSSHQVAVVGAEATLPCGNQRFFQSCPYTDWIYTSLYSYMRPSYQLVRYGRVDELVKPGRLSLTQSCSLVIKSVQNEDSGRYTCRSNALRQDFSVFLSVLPNDAMTTKEPLRIKTTTVELRTTSTEKAADASPEAASGCSALDYVMLSMRVAELVLITVITALLFRAQRNVAPAENKTVFRDGTVNYVNVGESSASANKHR